MIVDMLMQHNMLGVKNYIIKNKKSIFIIYFKFFI